MNKIFKCVGEHDFKVELPDEIFGNGELILPCPQCGRRYVVCKDKEPELFEREPIRFLAMHY